MKQQGIGWHTGDSIVRRGLLLAGAFLLASTLLPSVGVLRARSRKPVCPGGRFLVTSGPLLASDTALEPLVISGAQASIGRACPPAFAKLTATRRGQVKLRVTWPTCAGIVGKAQLKGTISADCASIGGTFVVRKSRIRKTFSAQRSACGDGVLDGEGGEQCDGGTGCGPGEACFTCACFPEGQVPTSTTSTTSPTTTTAPTTTTTTTSTTRVTTSSITTTTRAAHTTTTTSTTSTTLPSVVSLSTDVQPILTSNCATVLCHTGAAPAQGLNLQAGKAYGALVGVASTECPPTKLVAPGAPEVSYMVWKIKNAGPCLLGTRMPAAVPLSASNINLIVDWITQGAANN